jgi:putative inorganic carbon (hco3(-)) transporter
MPPALPVDIYFLVIYLTRPYYMGKILLLLLIICTAAYSLVQPWIGINAYYLLAILGPQYIWFWNFEGLRVSYIVAFSVLLGVATSLVLGKLDFSFLKTKLNLWVILLWMFIIMSYFFGSYVPLHKTEYGLSPHYLFSMTNKIYLFYLCATVAINDIRKLRYFVFILVVATIYMIYWANLQYFTANWDQFSMGRLKGPEAPSGDSIYRDENAFSMLFVTGIPFIYYLGFGFVKKWQRYAWWGIIIFGWHAIFLTGSRGGFLGIAITILVIIYKSKQKYFTLLLLPVFIVFFLWQGGQVMKDRSASIDNYQEDRSTEMRITAWKGGARMIVEHPFVGVGLGSFIIALPHFIESTPRVAHNTFVQFAAESGVGAGLCYIFIVLNFLRNSRIINLWYLNNELDVDYSKYVAQFNNASLSSFIGLIVCSFFLSLNSYEIFFYLIIINNCLVTLCQKKV